MDFFKIARSVKAGGLSGLAALAVVYLAQRAGYTISSETAITIVGAIITLVTHIVPDSAKQQVDALAKKLDMTAVELAQQVPQIEAVYPGKDGSDPTNISNIQKYTGDSDAPKV